MRWLTFHYWSLICLGCLFVSGCAAKQGAHFSVAPELDHQKIEAIAQSVKVRTKPLVKKTIESVKSDQPRVTGFNKRKRNQEQRHQKQSVRMVLAESNRLEPEVDDFADFHRIELAESQMRLKQQLPLEDETPFRDETLVEEMPPVVAEKPVFLKPIILEEPEPKPVIEVTFRTSQEIQAETSKDIQPETNKVEDSKSSQMVDLGLKPLSQLTLKIKPSKGDLPTNTAAKYWHQIPPRQVVMGESRDWSLVTKEWEAPSVAYFPLYFEEPYLERYGYNYGVLQPFVSAGRFFGRIPALPYMLGAYPPDECMYSLGLARPGSCPPYQVEKLPFSWRGSIYTGVTATGLVFLIP